MGLREKRIEFRGFYEEEPRMESLGTRESHDFCGLCTLYSTKVGVELETEELE